MIICKKFLFIIAVGFLIPVITYSQGEAIISGSFESATGNEIVYIESNRGIKDSVSIRNKKFKFILHPGDQWDVYFISVPELSQSYRFPVFLKENSHINVAINKTFDGVNISGDVNAREQDRFYKGADSVSKPYKFINKEIAATKDLTKLAQLNSHLENWDNELRTYYINWIKMHRESPFAVAVIRLFISQAFSKGEDTLAQKCFNLLLPGATKNNYQAYLLTWKFASYNDKYSKVQLNSEVPDFIVTDTSGKKVRLSDFKNSFLLIDFWASWCAPCRQNNPLLQKLYAKYKERGLNVLSISVDTDSRKWKEAIREDNMGWLQGSDLLGVTAGTAFNFQILGVPQYFLIGPDGRILLKSTGGDIKLVESKLKEVLK